MFLHYELAQLFRSNYGTTACVKCPRDRSLAARANIERIKRLQKTQIRELEREFRDPRHENRHPPIVLHSLEGLFRPDQQRGRFRSL